MTVKGIKVPCRKCIECRVQYSDEWAKRVMLEAKKYDKNCFITLTYNEDNLPDKASLKKRDFQLFMKRLRKQLERFAIKIRFFACGEYGSKGKRPHYHAIIFNWFPDDAYYFMNDNKGQELYRSKLLEKCWTYGFSSIGKLTIDSAKYCAKYMQADLQLANGREKPFTLCSRKPGIALDVIPSTVYKTGDIYFNGKKYTAPRSFLKKVKEQFPEYYEILKYKKYSTADKLFEDFNLHSSGYYTCDDSIKLLVEQLKYYEEFNNHSSIEIRRKKFKNIFGNSLDKCYRPLVSLKRKGTMRKSRVLRIVIFVFPTTNLYKIR